MYLIIGKVNVQARTKEFPFRSDLYRQAHLRFHLFKRSRIRCLYSPTGQNVSHGIRDIQGNVISHLTPRGPHLTTRHLFG